MKLLTTLQVRDIMRANGGVPEYTNKTTGHTGRDRRVKCYYNGNAKMVTALQKVCGKDNVKVTSGELHRWSRGSGVTVKCILA